MDLNGKVAIVTGGTKGIDRGIEKDSCVRLCRSAVRKGFAFPTGLFTMAALPPVEAERSNGGERGSAA